METLYERIQLLCEDKGVSVSKMCLELGMSKSTLSDLKNGRTKRLSVPTSKKIAAYLGVSVDYLIDGYEGTIKRCPECGLQYDSNDIEEVSQHNERHEACLAAIAKNSFFWTYEKREEIKANARNQLEAENPPQEKYIELQLDIFRALFSRSIEASGFDPMHPEFKEYVSMLLNQKQWKRTIRKDVYDSLVLRFGTKAGIEEGTYYKKLAAYGQQEMPAPWSRHQVQIPTGFQAIPPLRRVPRVGRIACGEPITAEENVEGYDEVPEQWGCDFTLVCCGDSMLPRIQNGDVVAIRKQEEVQNGQIAAVRIGDEATLKFVYRHADYIELRPANPAYESIIRRRDDMNDVRIEGRAVGLFRVL